jgi:hypothetical protein
MLYITLYLYIYTFVALDHTIAHHISATKRYGTEGPCGDANFGSGRGLSRGQDRRVRSAGIGGIPINREAVHDVTLKMWRFHFISRRTLIKYNSMV